MQDLRNTIGNIPVSWYDGLDHVGYDHDAKPINAISKKGQIEEFLEKMDDPDFWLVIFYAVFFQSNSSKFFAACILDSIRILCCVLISRSCL